MNQMQGMESKAPTAYRTISEVATSLDVPQHVLRFWESKFQQIRPLKRGGGRRYYRPEDVTLISNIKELLYNQGFTIKGVQKLLKETGRVGIVRPSQMAQAPAAGAAVTPPSQTSMSAATASLHTPTTIAPAIAAATLAKPSSGLSAGARREVEGVLAELKAMRELLRQNGV